MNPSIYHILHLLGLFTLVAFTAGAIFHPTLEKRKSYLRNTGIASLVVLVSGFALSGKLGIGFPVWVLVKIACWFVLSGAVSVAYRKSPKAAGIVTATAVSIAVMMVYLKPF